MTSFVEVVISQNKLKLLSSVEKMNHLNEDLFVVNASGFIDIFAYASKQLIKRIPPIM